jgi:Protein of unknown function (DUF3551)
MRLPILLLFLTAAALLAEIQTASAQSPTSYPWCARYFGSWMVGATSCYFSSYQQCRTTMSGIGGLLPKPILQPGCVGPPRAAAGTRNASTLRKHPSDSLPRRSHRIFR